MEPATKRQRGIKEEIAIIPLPSIAREDIEKSCTRTKSGKFTFEGVEVDAGTNSVTISASFHDDAMHERPYPYAITKTIRIDANVAATVRVTLPLINMELEKGKTFRVDQKGIAIVRQNPGGDFEICKEESNIRISSENVALKVGVQAGIPTRFCVAVIDSTLASLIQEFWKFRCDNPECRNGGRQTILWPSGTTAGKDWPLNACPNGTCHKKVIKIIEEAYKEAQQTQPVLQHAEIEQEKICHTKNIEKQAEMAFSALGSIESLNKWARSKPQHTGVAATVAMWIVHYRSGV